VRDHIAGVLLVAVPIFAALVGCLFLAMAR
jgi:hypothetical protein